MELNNELRSTFKSCPVTPATSEHASGCPVNSEYHRIIDTVEVLQ